MTLADRSSNRARRSARSNAKPAPEARSVRGEVDSEERRTIHTIPVSDEGIPGSIQHPLFGILIRRFGEFLFEVDHGGKFVTAWTSRNDLLQPRRAGVFGKRPREVFGYDISRALDQIVQSVIRHKVRADYEFPIDLPGGCRWFHALAYSVGGPAKAASSMCLMARDITQRKNADFRLSKREALLAHAEQVTQTGCWELDVKTGRRDWSLQLFRLYGLDPSQGVPPAESMFAMIDPEDRERVRGILESAIKNGTAFQSEGRYTLPDGRVRIIFMRGLPLLDEAGKTVQLVSVAQDVTETRQTAERQRKNESLLLQAEELANLGSWEYDVANQRFIWSAQMFRMLGISPDEQPVPLGRACALFHTDDRIRVWQEVKTLLQNQVPLENEVRFVLPDGRIRIFQSRAVCVADDAGRPVRILGTSQDVTEQKLAEGKLRESERLLAQAEAAAGLGSWEIHTADGTVVCSRECFRLFNMEPFSEPVPVEKIWSILHLEDPESARRALNHTIATNTPFEHISRCTMADGSIRVYHSRGIPYTDAYGHVARIVGFNHDITEQTRTEDDLRRLSRQLLTLRSEEQRRIARELHETASQTLAALKMTLRQIGDLLPETETRGQDLVRSAGVLTADAIREVRTISSILHPPLMDEVGLAAGLRTYAKLFAERSGLAVDLSIPEDLGRLSKEAELTVFCVIQEALANVHRHAKANSAAIRIERTPRRVTIQITDNGIGMSIFSPPPQGEPILGIGISGMRERVKQLNGEFLVSSSVGIGTTIQVVLPLSQKEGHK
ncbi:MAG: PAS domain-containing protein [Candidatus Acidiferrales bacterium]